MCSIILRRDETGLCIAANRDEMASRPWDPPADYWPGICGGRDLLAGGTWAAVNRHGVVAALLNRQGTLGPATGKESRGMLPLLALTQPSARAGLAHLRDLDCGRYRSFNLVLADALGAILLRGLEAGRPDVEILPSGTTMITSGEPNDTACPRIARHLPRFTASPFAQWGALLADSFGPRAAQINIPSSENNGFGTVCAMLIRLPRQGAPAHCFAAGPPDKAPFQPIPWPA